MKELTSTFNALLQDKRVRSEQGKYESITRQRTAVMSKYKRIYQEFLDLDAGLQSAKGWYREMKDTVDSLDKNVETFVSNRRSEGASLLSQIEQDRAASATGQADRERERLRGLMERMSMDPSPTTSKPPRAQSVSYNSSSSPGARYPTTNFAGQYQVPTSPAPQSAHPQSAHPAFTSHNNFASYQTQSRPDHYAQKPTPQPLQSQGSYNPSQYPQQPTSPPPAQSHFSQTNYGRQPTSPPPNQQQFSQSQYGRPPAQSGQGYIPPGYVPPPPPPGPPPLGPQQTFQQPGEYGYGNQQQRPGQQSSGDPWAGLNAWK